ISADTRTLLDGRRSTAAAKLTGMQLSHFGAFYRTSWRANDWMWGRLDGAGWIVHLMLGPDRLLDLRDQAAHPETFADDLLAELARICAGSGPPGEEVRSELQALF